ncbi:hypothetical protein NE237_010532 [Protea cynaroides]|uniref:Uncharacterized protein n=1 Tax=Protea cynaroides TaxID=273540 RepID=A0A9Q0R1P6_9MAGN|nr:hypothetical protein NE237_010532 [Protea cynaroides]
MLSPSPLKLENSPHVPSPLSSVPGSLDPLSGDTIEEKNLLKSRNLNPVNQEEIQMMKDRVIEAVSVLFRLHRGNLGDDSSTIAMDGACCGEKENQAFKISGVSLFAFSCMIDSRQNVVVTWTSEWIDY